MTKVFDDNSRVLLASRLFAENLDHNGMAVREMEVRKTTVSFAREYISTYHYTKTMPDSTMFVFAGWYGETLAGIIVFGMGSGKNQYTALVPEIKNGEYLELTRLWSPDGMPRNTESKLIMKSISMLPKEIKLIVSFADPSRNHAGTIYQATNFYYCGMSAGGKVIVTEDGIEKHPRLLGIYRMRHPEYKDLSNDELMKICGYTYKKSSPKHRYVLLRGSKFEKKNLYKFIAPLVSAYPKMGRGLTTAHAASSYGQPVFVDDDGQAYNWSDILDVKTTEAQSKGGSAGTDLQNKARAANAKKGGYPKGKPRKPKAQPTKRGADGDNVA